MDDFDVNIGRVNSLYNVNVEQMLNVYE